MSSRRRRMVRRMRRRLDRQAAGRGRGPTPRELAAGLGVSRSDFDAATAAMLEAGMLRRTDGGGIEPDPAWLEAAADPDEPTAAVSAASMIALGDMAAADGVDGLELNAAWVLHQLAIRDGVSHATPLDELAAEMDMTPASMTAASETLERHGWLHRSDGDPPQFSLGAAAWEQWQ